MPTIIAITRACPFCNKHVTKTFSKQIIDDGIAKYRAGALIQEAFPTLSPDDREFLKTGICDDCWNNM